MKLTKEEKEELDALNAKSDLTDQEKARKTELEAKGSGESEETFSKVYVDALRKESAKYRTRANEKDTELAKFKEVDVDEYLKLKEKIKEADNKKLVDKGEFDILRQQLVDQHKVDLDNIEADKATLQTKIDSLEKELDKTILGHEIAIQATVADAWNPKLVEMVALNKTRVALSEGGTRIIEVVDADGSVKIDLKTGKPYTVAQLLSDMKIDQEYAGLFKGATVGGNSGGTNFNGKSVENPWKLESLNLTLQGKIFRENPDLANRLQAEAGV